MCGVAGIIDLQSRRDIPDWRLDRMLDALAYRGPDDEGRFVEPGVTIGHRRLSIIDPAGGAQPFLTHCGDGVLSFNGEIYNFQSLAQDLRDKGHTLRTRSDAEALGEYLTHYETDALPKIDGMFAFAHWRRRSRTLLLARDRFGEKPLFYAITRDGLFVFASETRALLASGLVNADLDQEAIVDYAHLGHTVGERTIYKSIKSVAAGNYLIIKTPVSITNAAYSDSTNAAARTHTNEHGQQSVAGLGDSLDEAVRSRLISDVPVGAFLSGGIDSGLIVSSIARSNKSATSFTIGFDDNALDERPAARLVSREYARSAHEFRLSVNATDAIDILASAYDEPFADPSAVAYFLMCEAARKHATVWLGGDGADELFSGYRRHSHFAFEERARQATPAVMRRALPAIAKAMPKMDWAPRPLRWKSTLNSLGAETADAYFQMMCFTPAAYAADILHPDIINETSLPPSALRVREIFAEHEAAHPLQAAMAADLAIWLPDRMLRKVDRASMAHGLEVRSPYLAPPLVNAACQWPFEAPRAENLRKGPLRALANERLAAPIATAPKRGFAPPLAAWLRNKSGPMTRLYDSSLWSLSGLFNSNAVHKMIKTHQSGRRDYSQALWTVIMFDAFLQTQNQMTKAA
ncbi:MAG: asparagine synthase (glutamine-hydrolyzing) [Pseudomonadota bacterium]